MIVVGGYGVLYKSMLSSILFTVLRVTLRRFEIVLYGRPLAISTRRSLNLDGSIRPIVEEVERMKSDAERSIFHYIYTIFGLKRHV